MINPKKKKKKIYREKRNNFSSKMLKSMIKKIINPKKSPRSKMLMNTIK